MIRLLSIPALGFACFFYAEAWECWSHVVTPHFNGDRLVSFGVAVLMSCAAILATLIMFGLAAGKAGRVLEELVLELLAKQVEAHGVEKVGHASTRTRSKRKSNGK